MLRNLLTMCLSALLLAGLLVPAMSSSHERRSGGEGMDRAIEQLHRFELAGIRTFNGAPNPHKRGLGCYGCHTSGAPPAKVGSAPEEPCAECHPRLTERQVQMARQFCATGPACPVTYRVWHRPSGRWHYWFFGLN